MPRIEFYVLSSTAPADRLRAACQLAMKAWRHGMPVFMRASDEAQCAEVDELCGDSRPKPSYPTACTATRRMRQW